LVSAVAAAQTESKEVGGSVFESLSRLITVVGEKTEGLLPPYFRLQEGQREAGWAGLTAVTREIHESYPIRAAGSVAIAREFGEGELRIETWDNPVVQFRAEIAVGSETEERANELIEAFQIQAVESPDRVELRSQYPDTRDKGKVAVRASYFLTVPKGVGVTCKNDWGDTFITGVGGPVEIDARFGAVDIRDVSGNVRVRALGDFPLRGSGLRQGGAFELQGTRAEFANVSGKLQVANFMGSVSLRDLAQECEWTVTSESGPVRLSIPENARPDVNAHTVFGTVQADTALEQSTLGNVTVARSRNLESKQRVHLTAYFDTITIQHEGLKPVALVPPAGGEYVRRTVEAGDPAPEGVEVMIRAALGDVRVEGVDSDRLEVRATQVVQMRTNANAQAALEALSLRLERLDGRLLVTTAVRDNMEALGCTHYRIDLEVRCPRPRPLRIAASSGATSILEMAGPIHVEQAKGTVTAERCRRDQGTFELVNREGDVIVTDCAGPAEITTMKGQTRTLGVTGRQVISAQGKTVIESPKGEVAVNSRGGEVTILALEGIQGDYSVQVEEAPLNILIPPTSDATLWVTARNGQVNSWARLTGTIERELRSLQGQLGNGQHRVELTTQGGDIYID
jgi:hypothetical protein